MRKLTLLITTLFLSLGMAWAQTFEISTNVGDPEHQYLIKNGNDIWMAANTAPTQNNKAYFAFFEADGDDAYKIYSVGEQKWVSYDKTSTSADTKGFASLVDSKDNANAWKITATTIKGGKSGFNVQPFNNDDTVSDRYWNWNGGVNVYGGYSHDDTRTIGLWKQNAATDAGSGWVLLQEGGYSITDAAGNVFEGEDPIVNGQVDGFTLKNVVWDGSKSKYTATINFPFSVSKEGGVINMTTIASVADAKKWCATDDAVIMVQTSGYDANDNNWLWAIYPQFDNGAFSFKIKSIGKDKWIYTNASGSMVDGGNNDDSAGNAAGAVQLTDEGTAFAVVNSYTASTYAFHYKAGDSNQYLSINSKNDTKVYLGVHTGIHVGSDCRFSYVKTVAPVAKIGETAYYTFAEALAATKTMTGDVTVELYDKVTFNQPLTGNYTSINFVGKDTDAEMYLEVQGYTTATGKKVSFTDLKLSKSEGGFIANAGFMNVAFGIYDVEEVTYTNCTFENGAYAAAGNVTFTGCTFKKSWDKYGLWAYGNVDVTVQNSTFADYRGIKMYAENGAAESVEKANLTVKNTDFSAVDNKPAIVLTYGESVVLEGNTYSSTGTFELDLDGKPNGVAVTSDVAPVCVNDNGACGVLVDGKIYTTVAQAADEATSGSNVTLLHNSTETVEFAYGVNVNKNNFTAPNVTVEQPLAGYVVLPEGMDQSNYKSLFGDNTVTDGTNYYATMVKALEGIHKGTATVLYCKPGADLGTMTHGHVCRSLTIYGNGAKISGGEQDFELDTYKFCHSSSNTCEGITAEVNLTVKHLDGCGAWGQRTTGNTLNIVFEECKDMNRVYISGTTGINNITLTNCSFLGTVQKQCTLYSNANGQVNVTGTTFSGIYAPVNLNHKVAGTQDVNVVNCAFTDCGTAEYDYAAPVRVLSSVEGAQSTLTVNNTTFTGTKANKLGQTADILLDYGVGETTASVTATAANVFVEKENNVATKTTVTESEGGEFTNVVPVAKVNGIEYMTLAKAVADAQAGDEIVLIADVKTTDGVVITDKNLTIDLNGKTYTVTEGASTNNRNFKINGTSVVTVKNGTMVAAGEYSSGAYGTIRTEGTANVTLTGLKLYNYRGNGLNIKACAGTTVTIENTEIYANYGGGIESAGGTIVVNNGVIVEQKGMYTAPYNSMAISVNGGGKVTVNGGTFSTECLAAADANNQGTSHGPWVAGVLNSGGTLIINGGTFSNDNFGDNSLATHARGAILADTKAKVEIKGGTFNVLKNVIDIQNNLGDANNNPSVLLVGGTYSADPRTSAQYGSNLITLAEDYIAVKNNGVWNVVKAAAKIGEQGYATLNEAFAAATEGQTITLLDDATPALTSQRAITKAAVIDLGGKTMTLTEDDLYFGTTTFMNGTIVVDPSVKASTAVFWMFANQTLTFDNVKIVATGVTGTYLIGLDGNNSDLNLLNGSEILVENTTALDLDIICVNASTGNDIVVENSKVNVANLDGRVFFRGNYTVKDSEVNLAGITKAGFRIEAGQTLSIEGTSKVNIEGEPRDGGIHMTDLTATYTKAETATVNATLNEVTPAAVIGTQKFASLQAAVNAVKNGETITLTSDVTENVTLTEKVGLYYTIDGADKTMNGKIVITPLSDTNDNRRITIKDINFVDAADANVDFISSVNTNHYPRLTIEDCSFTGSGNDGDVAVRLKSSHSVVITNCSGTGLHSFIQNTSGWNLTIENVTVTDSKSAFALGTVQGVTVKGVNVDVAGYGIRLDAQYNNNAVLENNTVKAFIPVVVRKAEVAGNVTVKGTNNFTANNEDGIWCAVGTSEYEANGQMPTAATAEVKVALVETNLDAAGIYGSYYDALTIHVGAAQNSRMVTRDIYVATMDKAVAEAKAINAGAVTYKVYGEVELTTGGSHGILDLGKNVVIEGADDAAKLTIVGGGVPDIKGVTFKNIILADEGTYLPTANEFMYQNYIDCTFEKVTFVDGIRLSGTSSIKDSKVEANTTNEYAIWLDAGEFTMTGTTVVGGADAYGLVKSDAVSKITITGNTFQYLGEANKEALNTKGAVIIAENNQFIECTKGILPADKTNYTDDSKTTVATDATIAANNTVTVYYAAIGEQKFEKLADAFAAAQAGDEVVILKAGTYALNGIQGKNITVTGAVAGVEFANIGAFGCNGANVTFNNVTFTYAENSTYKGLQHAGNLVYNNCTINGQVFLYGNSETFNNCTFNTTDAANYNVWTYGAKEVAFNECTFNSAGKSVLIYAESASITNNVTVSKSTFKASQVVEGKAAIEMDSSLSGAINLTIDGATTATGFATGNVSGNSLWNNKKGNSTDANNDITVKVGDETVLAPVTFVVKVGDNCYATLAEAFAAVGDGAGKTVELIADVDLAGAEWTPVTFNGTFDGNGKTISNLVVNGAGKSNQGFFAQTNNGEIKNVTFNNAKVTGRLNVGVVAGTPYTSKYTNVKVTGHVEVNGMAYVGGVGGKNAYANWTDITVDVDGTSYVKATSTENDKKYRTYVGGVIGFNGEGSHTFKNISSNIKVIGDVMDIGGIFGILHYGNNAENITFTGAVEAPAEAKEVGGIAGVWHNQQGQAVTITNAKSEGTVEVGGVSTTGSIVGGAYNADNKYEANSGSLIIDGNEAWLPRKVTTKAELDAAIAAAEEGDIIVMDADIDYGTGQLAIAKAITLDLGGNTLTTRNAYGGMSIKNNPTVKNGNIVHASNTAAIKVWNATAFENLVIDVQGKGDANKTIGGIVLQSGSTTKVGSIKNVTIKGVALTNGIETYNCGDATENVIGAMENVTIDAQGTGLLISAPCGTATNCNIYGGVTGIELWIKGNYSATLALVDSDVKGGEKPVYVHDEFSTNPNIQNNGTLKLAADEATTFTSESGALAAVNIARAENADRTVVDKLIANAIVCVGDVYFDDFAKAWAAVKDGQTVTLLADIEATSFIGIDKSMTINGNGHKVTSSATRVFRVTTSDTEVTLNNVNMVSSAKVVYPNDVRGISIDAQLQNVKLTLNGCSVDFTDASACDWAYAVNVSGNGTGHTVTVNGGTYEGANVINVYSANNTVTVKDAVITCTYPNNDLYAGACIWVLQNQGSSVEATGNTFNGNNAVAFNLGTGTTLTASNNTDNTKEYISGEGTEAKPYLIKTAGQLVDFRNSVNAGETKYNAPGVWVALAADIDLANAEWTVGIGDGHNYSFDGNFDGKNHTIKNLNIKPYADADKYLCGGLFGYIYGGVTIKDLVIENVTITAEAEGHNVGILVGFANNNGGKANISNIIVKGDVKVNAPNAYGVGAIVGYSYRAMGAITNTKVLANAGSYIKGQRFVGGITGYSYDNAVITGCTVKNLAISGAHGVAGIAGLAKNGNKITNCTVETVTVEAENNVAYIVGELQGEGGDVTVADNNAPQPWVGGSYGTGESFVATIGTQYYTSIAKAIEAAKAGETIVLIRDVKASDIITINKAITLDLNGKKVTSTAKKAFEVYADATIQNGTIEAAQRCVDTRKAVELTLTDVTLIADKYTTHGNPQPLTIGGSENGTKVTMTNVNISAAAGYGIITFVETELTATNSTIGGYNALYVKPGSDNSVFNFVDSDLSGSTVGNDVEGNSFSVIAVRANDVTVNVDAASTVTAAGNYSYAISFKSSYQNEAATGSSVTVAGEITGNILTALNGNTVRVNAEYADELQAEGYATSVADGLATAKAAVAKIGDTNYATLDEAIKAAKAGDTVTVFEGTYKMPSVKAGITIVGEGNVLFEGTLTGSLENLTMKNIHIKGGNAQRWAYAKGDLVFENVTFEATSVYALHFDGIAAGTNLTYKDCTIIGWAALGGSPASCVFEGCTIKGNGTYGLIRTYFATTIKDCTFDVSKVNTNDVYQDGIHAVEGAIVTVDNCTNANGEMADIVNIHATSVVVLDGVEIKNVAKIGDTNYWTLQDAINAATEGATVTVLTDIVLSETVTVPAGKTITLDLNGKTISQTKECTASYEMINNKGNLTITDSSDAKDGKISFKDTGAGDPNFGWGSYTVRNEGNLVVENGTIEHLGEQTAHMYCAIFQYSGKSTINGGTISTPNYRSARLWKGEMTVNGGNFEGQLWVQAVDNTSNLVINGGTFAPRGNDGSSVFVTNSTYDVALAVTGGTFETKIGCSNASKLAGAITGGSFSASAKENTAAALIATGYVFGEADANGYYTIADDPATHYINNVEEFLAFRDAVNGGNDFAGVAVYLAADIDLAGIDWSVNIGDDCNATFDGTFDGQGHTIKNLTSTETAQKGDGYICTGLFGAIHGGAVLKNFTVENVNISTGDFTGNNVAAVVGFAYQVTGSIENVKVTGNININAANVVGVGAIIGYDYRSPALKVENCAVSGNDGSVIVGKSYVGGAVGYASNKIAINSNTVENVSVTATASVGAIAGIMLSGSSATDNIVKNVALTATGELWANSAAVVAGTITSGGVTVANTTVENVTANGAAAALVGGQLVEKPTAPIAKVEAKIGDKYYTTLENAYVAAQAGATVELLAPVTVAAGETLTLDKDVTITYTSNVAGEDMITNRGTLNISAGTLTYVNTDATASNVTVSTISSEPGSVLNITGGTVENKTVKADGSSIYSFAIDMLTNGSLGDVTATISGGTVYSDYMAIRQFNNGTACKNSLTINGGYIYGAKRAVQIHMDNNAAVTAINGGKVEAGADGYAICNFAATGNLEVTGGEFIGAVYSARENFISGGTYNNPVEAAYCAEGYMPNKNANGTYGVVAAQDAVAAVGGFAYATLADAVKAAKAGETITLLQNVKENVTINKNLTIDGADKTITGMITTDGKSLKVTIKNVNFDGDNKQQYYAVKADHMYSLTIQDCTAKNYAYGFLYANRDNYNVTVKNVTVENCANYGAYASSVSGSATFENFTVKGARYGVLVANKGTRNVNFKNVTFEGAETPLYINENGTGKVTFTFEGINEMSKAEYYTSQYVNVVAAAQAGTKVCGSLNEAFTAAVTGDIVKMLGDLSLTAEDAVKTTDGKERDVLFVVNGKEITLDMNGKKISVNHQSTTNAERLWAVIYVEDGAGLTVTGNGSIDVDANDNTPKVVYMFLKNGSTGYLVIENGNFHMDNSEDSMVFSGSSNTITVKGGTFILDAVASKTNGWPVFFGVNGTNTGYVNVLGGTYNYDITQQANGEVKIGSGFTIRDNGDDTWSVVTGVSIIDGQLTEYANDKTQVVEYISYKRKIAAGIWNPLYVPFEIPVEVLQELGYEVAIFYDVHFEITDGGVIDPTSTPDLHIVKIKEGTLKANYPYLIRATKDADLNLSLELENETLYSTAAKESVEAGSTTTRFIFAGTYTKATPEGLTGRADVPCYVLTSRGTFGKMATDARLSPFRVFMYVLAKDGSPVILNDVAAEAIRIRVIGESDSDTTEIKYYESDEVKAVDYIFDFQGRRVLEPQKGNLYIINGKKVIF